MNRRILTSFLAFALIFSGLGLLTGCGSDDHSSTPSSITVQSGSGQTVQVGQALTAFSVKVTNNAGKGLSGISVTFTAPVGGASSISKNIPGTPTCTFSGGATSTVPTDSTGLATSGVCTANTVAGAYHVTGAVSGVTSTASFSVTNTAGAATTIAVNAGDGQSATVGTAFATALSAVVADTNGNGVSGVTVTFTAPASSASGTFANETNTDVETTDANGIATATTFTANSTAGGPYTVAATASVGEADFSLTNTSAVANTVSYVFNASGIETADGGSYYAVAGVFVINYDNGTITGEEDFNDGFSTTTLANITSGTAVGGGNQGTISLVTDNPNLGVNGTQTFSIQFISPYHALITQFDGTSSSSGSLDWQDLSTVPSGGFSFTMSGVDTNYVEMGVGGVFTLGSGSISSGLFDLNDGGTVTTANSFTGAATDIDSFGRGTITGTNIADTIAYYVVNSKAIRLIDIDPVSSAVGSAFSQGTGTFDNTSLGTSVLSVQADPWGFLYSALGMFSTNGSGAFEGVGDINEQGSIANAAAVDGSYFVSSGAPVDGIIAPNGYGSMSFNTSLQDVAQLGIYLTDPTLNLNDPNNPSGGGGALVLDLDDFLAGGVGVITPQTDTATASFAGNYAFGAQDFNDLSFLGWEFDFTGEGTVDSGFNLNGIGMLNDTFQFFTDVSNLYIGTTYTGTATPDNSNPGRYTIPLTILNPDDSSLPDATVVIYQANGQQLYWMEEDFDSIFLGPLEQQNVPVKPQHTRKFWTRVKTLSRK